MELPGREDDMVTTVESLRFERMDEKTPLIVSSFEFQVPSLDNHFTELNALAVEVGSMLAGLMKYLRASAYKGTKFKSLAEDQT